MSEHHHSHAEKWFNFLDFSKDSFKHAFSEHTTPGTIVAHALMLHPALHILELALQTPYDLVMGNPYRGPKDIKDVCNMLLPIKLFASEDKGKVAEPEMPMERPKVAISNQDLPSNQNPKTLYSSDNGKKPLTVMAQ